VDIDPTHIMESKGYGQTTPQYQWKKATNQQVMLVIVVVFGALFFKTSPLGLVGIFTAVEIGTIYYSYHKNRK
jgi:hypothetical protein